MKKIVRTSGALGAAAALGLGLPACSKEPQAPPVVPHGGDSAGATTADPAGGEQTEAFTDATATAAEPDCDGKDALTEACGYASPTKYAVLDPTGIRNG